MLTEVKRGNMKSIVLLRNKDSEVIPIKNLFYVHSLINIPQNLFPGQTCQDPLF